MPKCIKIRRKKREVCIGDMRDSIIVQTRVITPPAAGGVDFTEVFTADATVWALVETKTGTEVFDGTNIKGIATHFFYIRFVANMTFENWVKYKLKEYDILDVQNLEERDEFYLLRCSLRGTTNNLSNLA